MKTATTVSGEQLANTLHTLGVRFLLGGQPAAKPLPPVRLLIALAESEEARLRLALIPLFLARPEMAAHAQKAAARLSLPARHTLQCYYTAAVDLQRLHRPRITALLGEPRPLPDLFSGELSLPAPEIGAPLAHLQALAQRHQFLTDTAVNWLGTYQHAAQTWLKGLALNQHTHAPL